MKRERRFRWAMASIFAASAVVAVAEGYSFRKTVAEYTEVVRNSSQVIERLRNARKLQATLLNAESEQRGYLLTGDQTYRPPFDAAAALLETRLGDFMRTQTPERHSDIAAIEATVTTRLATLRDAIRLYDSEGFEAALTLVKTGRGKTAMDQFEATIEKFIAEDSVISARLQEGIARKSAGNSSTWFAMNIAIVVGLLAGMSGLWRASRKIGELANSLAHEAHHDILTGLPNRAYFTETLGYVLALAERENRRVAILFLDLDGFKAINDGLGHDMGDLALAEVAKALRGVLRESDFAARLGGDEFTVIVSTIKDACIMCERIETAIGSLEPPELQGYKLGTSIGVAVFPDDGHGPEDLVATADTRMFEQKRARKAGTKISNCLVCKDSVTLCEMN